ncbi:MAG: hypothetical protein CL414_02670 [Acidimicrobiaceae bacterium]|nr:hypothetical protein [Acidimicrobiaceae bacterium]|tara:strand:- start:1010 stop:1234 length:225 start_codon:yes stop_codon:yes gene_type:complete
MATATIVNVSTGEVITRELTAEEEAERQARDEERQARREEEEAVEAQRQEDAAAGRAKLKELGLTDEQIAALLG